MDVSTGIRINIERNGTKIWGGVTLCAMWKFPDKGDQGSNLSPLQWKHNLNH